ncbi:MAG: hypothetical protein II859_09885 [Bacteroidales bacterium]|nr:hypothetical protein [Bacteroidales bacterium]
MAEENNTEKLQEAKGIKDEIKKQNRKNAFYFTVIVVVLALWILLGMLTIRQLWWLYSVQKTPLDLILVIFVITVLTVMAALAVRFLHKRMTEKDQEITRWRTKLLDAYGCLLEAEVNVVKKTIEPKKEKTQIEKDIEEKKQKLELEKLKLELHETTEKLQKYNEK